MKYRCLECNEVFEDDFAEGVGGLAPAECPRCGEEHRIVRESWRARAMAWIREAFGP